jgi:mono/diheme cytochrome c family protein
VGTVWQGTVSKYFYAVVALVTAAVIIAVLFTTWPDFLFGRSNQLTQGQALYRVHCARCHGKNLEGQPYWQTRLPSGRMPAPPHDKSGHTWHHSDNALLGVTKLGLKPFAGENYESDMPAFKEILKDEEIDSILAYIKITWPEREREYQRQLTEKSK